MAENFGTSDTVQYLLSRFQRLMLEQRLFAVEWQDIADHMIPRKNSIIVQRYPGSKRTQKLYDSTAADALEKLAASIHGTLTSSYIPWFFLETDDPELNEIQPVAEWLQKCSTIMLGWINKSNFAQEAHEMYIDLAAFGTGAVFLEEQPPNRGFGGFLFRSVPIGKFCAAEGPDGHINAIFRSFPMSAEAIRLKKGWQVPKELSGVKPDKKYEIIHGVFPDRKGGPKWESIYLVYQTKSQLSESTFNEFPFMVPRWSKLSDETYGRGPGHTALPDTRSLQKIVELELRRIALDVHPPMKNLQGDVVGPIRLVPGGNTTVRNMEGLQPLLTGAEQTFQIVNLKKEDLVQSIRRIFYYDQLQLPQGPQMTAEEVMSRMELMERLLGPTTGRLESEWLRPLIDRSWGILMRAQILPPPPEELQNARQQRNVPLRIRYTGPLARAQKSADAQAVQKLVTLLTPMIQFKPEIIDVFDWDEGARHTAEVLGVPAKMIHDEAEVQRARADRQKKIDAQQAAMEMSEGAKAAGAAAPMVKAMNQKPDAGSPAMMPGMMPAGFVSPNGAAPGGAAT